MNNKNNQGAKQKFEKQRLLCYKNCGNKRQEKTNKTTKEEGRDIRIKKQVVDKLLG